MNFCLRLLALILLAGTICAAQVTIQNPQHLEIPEQRVQALHRVICRAVADEFHVRGGRVEGPVLLVLRTGKEITVADEANGLYTIYLDHWDELTFTVSDLRLAVQRMVSSDRWQRMVEGVIHRVGKMSPVDAHALRNSHEHGSLSAPNELNNCISAVRGPHDDMACSPFSDTDDRHPKRK
jgi:hypothetical protein